MPPAYVPRTLESDPYFMLLLSCAKNNSGTVDWHAVGDSMDLSAVAAKARFERLIKAQNSAGEGGAGAVAGLKAKALTKAKRVMKAEADGEKTPAKKSKVTKKTGAQDKEGSEGEKEDVEMDQAA